MLEQTHLRNTYRCWSNMKNRCFSKNNKYYDRYGERGITVCSDWMEFNGFYKDMGNKPENMSLDRIDNNKGYSKENCKWSNIEDQNNNRHNSLLFKGLSISQWCRKLEMPRETVWGRIKRGWSTEDALLKKVKVQHRRKIIN